MTAEQWVVTWGMILGAWPGRGMSSPEAEMAWGKAFADKDVDRMADAVIAYAQDTDRPSIAGLTIAYYELEQDHLRDLRLATASSPPSEQYDPPSAMPDFNALYQALDPLERDAIEDRIKGQYTAAYAGRNTPGNLQWAWRCLTVTCAEKGIDPKTNGYLGSATESARDAEVAHYRRKLASAQAQIQHEEVCARCASYSSPGVGKARKGEPCPIGVEYYRPLYALQGNKWA